MVMFTPLKLTTDSNNILWREQSPASPSSCRPLSLMLGKETDDDLKLQYKTLFTEKRAALQEVILLVHSKERQYKVNIIFKLSLIDGK